ncbi:type II secretion system protein [Methylotenera sp.]|uniref:pilus assembly FimT family protein n=1 Tax=Methylotenera sp. TaxID=2051956 RepID=UPI002489E3A6|nr:type II secretion system protein [Methylotenera sp.]MDI1298379.1 type II secretion system protein [Methylotenera sp.]
MNKIAQSGFSLLEMMIVVTILGVVATVTLPLLGSNDPQKLNVAAEETANTLRFALSEARRTNGYVLIDGRTTSGRLRLYYSTSNGNLTSAIIDPLTKRATDLNVTNSAFSQGVTLTPQFRAGGSARTQLLIAPNVAQMQGFDGIGGNEGALQANSGVLLRLGSQSTFVSINQTTGLVTLP